MLKTLIAAGMVALTFAIAVPGASAAVPVQLTPTGTGAKAAVAPDGTAHVVWLESSPSVYTYCRIPAGATTCDLVRSWPSPGSQTNADSPGVFVSPTQVVITQYWCCSNETWVVASNDGGTTFAPQTFLAGDDGSPGAESAVGGGDSILGPGNAVTSVEPNLGPFVQQAVLGAVTTNRTDSLGTGAPGPIYASIGFDATTAVLAWNRTDDVLSFRTAPVGSDLNLDANWTPAQVVPVASGSGGAAMQLASGPNGIFLMYETTAGPLEIRRWTGTDFGPATAITDSARFSELIQDPAGGLHAVWHPNASNEVHLLYRYSPDGVNWDPAVPLVDDLNTTHLQPAVNASGNGLVVFDDRNGGTSFVGLPPPPVLGESVNVAVVEGTVKRKCKGDNKFTALDAPEQIPVGCTLDTKKGTVNLTSALGDEGITQTSDFYDGVFKVQQKAKANATTDLILTKGKCGKKGRAAVRAVDIGGDKIANGLWGKGNGKFKTQGGKGSASIRGTTWFVGDTCGGATVVKVKEGTVVFRDFVKDKNVTVKAGETYVAGGR